MKTPIKISEDLCIGDDYKCFLIAEIGQNHQGDINIAKKLIQVAKDCGANCAKFQKCNLREKFNLDALKRPYVNVNSWGDTYQEHKEYLEFNIEQYKELQTYALDLGIAFSGSAMDVKAVDDLYDLNVPFIKIGSGDANNLPLIRYAASKNVPLVISTGMQNHRMVRAIYDTVTKYHKKLVLMHCVSSYPVPLDEINLQVLNTYKQQFPDIYVGYSGHEINTDVCIAAAALGAKVIERHLTLDRCQKGNDHVCSLTPFEFKKMVNRIRHLEVALGQPLKSEQLSEIPCFNKLGKSIVISGKKYRGHVLTENDLKIKVAEPKGIDGSCLMKVIGRKLKIDLDDDQTIFADYLT